MAEGGYPGGGVMIWLETRQYVGKTSSMADS